MLLILLIRAVWYCMACVCENVRRCVCSSTAWLKAAPVQVFVEVCDSFWWFCVFWAFQSVTNQDWHTQTHTITHIHTVIQTHTSQCNCDYVHLLQTAWAVWCYWSSALVSAAQRCVCVCVILCYSVCVQQMFVCCVPRVAVRSFEDTDDESHRYEEALSPARSLSWFLFYLWSETGSVFLFSPPHLPLCFALSLPSGPLRLCFLSRCFSFFSALSFRFCFL